MSTQDVDLTPVTTQINDSNVTFLDGQEQTAPVISPPIVDTRSTVIEGSELKVAEELLSRWTQIDCISISATDTVNKVVGSYDFPSSLSKGKYAKNSNLALILKNYLFMRGDVELRFVVNANKFQVGQVQVSAYYGEEHDININLRNNVYSRSQMMHQLISLHNNKIVNFEIPYVNPKTYVRTMSTVDNPLIDFVTVKALILNPLRVADNTYSSCKIAVFARFKNVQLTGMIPNVNNGPFDHEMDIQSTPIESSHAPIEQPYLAFEDQMSSSYISNFVSNPDLSIAYDSLFPLLPTTYFQGNPDLSIAYDHLIDTADHEMMAVTAGIAAANSLIGLGERAVRMVKGFNRDYPRDPRPDTVVIPRQSPSWCYGTNTVSSANILRLDPKGSTPEVERDEMSISTVTSTYGLVSQFQWTHNDIEGKTLFSDNVAPISDRVNKLLPAKPNLLAVYTPAPVGVVSSCFAYWRGSMRFRFDFIASFMHTGRVMATFYPGKNYSYTTPIGERTNLLQVIFDLEESQSFTFEVPFTWDKEWCSLHTNKRYNLDPFPPGIGKVDLSVLTPLIPNDAISNIIDCNVYVCGGDDFEVSVPVNPEIALGWDRHFITKPTEEVKLAPGYTDVYVGYDIPAAQIAKFPALICHSKHAYAQANFQPGVIYSFSDSTTLNNGGEDYGFFIGSIVYQCLLCFKTLEAAKVYLMTNQFEPPLAKSFAPQECGNKRFVIEYSLPEIVKMIGDMKTMQASVYKMSLDKYNECAEAEDCEHEMDDNIVANPLTTHAPLSIRAFGEKFTHFKDVIRRFQYYTDYATTLTSDLKYGSTIVRFPICPGGLEIFPQNSDRVDEIQNRMRNGIIPIVASGYRFFSGSLRIKILATSSDPNLFLQVMHVPELRTSGYAPETPLYANNIDFITTGYAGYGQSLKLNQLMDLEIPYYLPGPRGYLQRGALNSSTDNAIFHSLGSLEISSLTPLIDDTKLDIRLFYAAADDTSFSHFTGFPPMVFPKEIPRAEPDESGMNLTMQYIKQYHPHLYAFNFSKYKLEEDFLTDIGKYCEGKNILKMDNTSICFNYNKTAKTLKVTFYTTPTLILTFMLRANGVFHLVATSNNIVKVQKPKILELLGLEASEGFVFLTADKPMLLKHPQKIQDLANAGYIVVDHGFLVKLINLNIKLIKQTKVRQHKIEEFMDYEHEMDIEESSDDQRVRELDSIHSDVYEDTDIFSSDDDLEDYEIITQLNPECSKNLIRPSFHVECRINLDLNYIKFFLGANSEGFYLKETTIKFIRQDDKYLMTVNVPEMQAQCGRKFAPRFHSMPPSFAIDHENKLIKINSYRDFMRHMGELAKYTHVGYSVYFTLGFASHFITQSNNKFLINSLRLILCVDIEHENAVSVGKESLQKISQILNIPFKDIEHEAFWDLFGFKSLGQDILKSSSMITSEMGTFRELLQTFVSSFQSKFTSGIHTAKTLMFEIMHILSSPTINTIAISITSILFSAFEGLNLVSSYFTKTVTALTSVLKTLFTSGPSNLLSLLRDTVAPTADEHQQPINAQEGIEFEDDEQLTFCGTLVSVVSWILNSKKKIRVPSDVFSSLFADLPKAAISHSHVCVFIRNIFNCLQSIYNYMYYTLYPQHKVVTEIFADSQDMLTWAEDSLYLTDPLYEARVCSSPQLINRLHECHKIGMNYKKNLVGKTNIGKNVIFIKEICNSLQKSSDALVKRGLMQNIRFEPFVLHLVGEPGIGKSRLIGELVEQMLHVVGIDKPNPIYTKTTGVEYWNNLAQQPVVLYDDFLAYNGAENKEALELFQLKSCAAFNPPRAKLEDKEGWYSPLIVVIVSNDPYPKTTSINNEKAFFRRRDVLAEAKFKPSIRTSYPNTTDRQIVKYKLAPKLLANFHHLEFELFSDPQIETSSKEIPGDGCFGDFKDYILNEWEKYFNKEISNFIGKTKVSLKSLDVTTGISMDQLKAEINTSATSKFLSLADSGYQIVRQTFDSRKIPDPTTNATISAKPIIKTKAPKLTPNGHHTPATPPPAKVVKRVKKSLTTTSTSLNIPSLLSVDTTLPPPPIEHNFVIEHESETSTILEEPSTSYHRFETVDDLKDEENVSVSLFDDWRAAIQVLKDDQEYASAATSAASSLVDGADSDVIHCTAHDMISGNVVMYVRTEEEEYGTFYLEDVDDEYLEISEKPCDDDNCLMKNPNCLKHRLLKYMEEVLEQDPQNCDVPLVFSTKLQRGNSRRDRIIKSLREIRDHPNVQRLWSTVQDSGFYQYWSQFRNIAAFFTGIAGAVLALYAIRAATGFDWTQGGYFGGSMDDMEGESIDDRPSGRKGKQKNSKKIASMYKNIRLAEHQSANVNQLEHIQNLVRRNAGYMSFVGEDGHRIKIKFFGVYGRKIISMKHFYETWMAHDKPVVVFDFKDCQRTTRLEPGDFECDPKSSVCLINLPRDFPEFKDCTKFIASVEEHDRASSDCVLMNIEYDTKLLTTSRVNAEFRHTSFSIGPIDAASKQQIEASYCYGTHGRGLCGSLLICNNSNPKIIGIHIAGSKSLGKGYAQPVIKEMFSRKDNYIQTMETPLTGEGNAANDGSRKTFISHEQGLFPIGIVDKAYTTRLPEKTKIIPLPTQGLFNPVLKEPAVLSPKDSRLKENNLQFSPLCEGLKKHAKPPIPFNRKHVQLVSQQISEKLISVCSPVLAQRSDELLNHKTIVEGIPGEQGYNSLEMRTSEGYPLTLMRPPEAKNKSWLFNLEDKGSAREFVSFNPLLQDEIDNQMALRKQNVCPNTIFVDALKDTTIACEKVLVPGKTRIFSVSPLEYTIAIRQYFGHFQAALIQNRIKDEVCVGVNADGMEWKEIVHYLNSVEAKEPNIVTGDYSHYGDTLQSECLAQAFEIMIDWYDHYYSNDPNHEENQKVRRVLAQEFLHVQHIAGNLVYRMFCGLPSGFALTVELNSIVNMMYMRLSWMYAFRHDVNKRSLAWFEKNVRLLTYGDDLIMSISDSCIENFNFNTIREFLEAYRIPFTHSSKKMDYRDPSESLSVATFLKRGFVPHPTRAGEFLGPLPDESIYGQLDWGWQTEDIKALVYNNMRAALNSAYSRGPAFYSELRKKLLVYAGEHYSEHARFDTWADIDARVFDDASYST